MLNSGNCFVLTSGFSIFHWGKTGIQTTRMLRMSVAESTNFYLSPGFNRYCSVGSPPNLTFTACTHPLWESHIRLTAPLDVEAWKQNCSKNSMRLRRATIHHLTGFVPSHCVSVNVISSETIKNNKKNNFTCFAILIIPTTVNQPGKSKWFYFTCFSILVYISLFFAMSNAEHLLFLISFSQSYIPQSCDPHIHMYVIHVLYMHKNL